MGLAPLHSTMESVTYVSLHLCQSVRPAARLAGAQQHPHNVMSAHFGRYRDFGLYTDSLAFYGSRMFYYVWDLPIFFTMGAIGGLMGALWVHVNVKITALRHRRINFRRARRAGPAEVACARGQACGWRAGALSNRLLLSPEAACQGLPACPSTSHKCQKWLSSMQAQGWWRSVCVTHARACAPARSA